jgi:hypothetical protein
MNNLTTSYRITFLKQSNYDIRFTIIQNTPQKFCWISTSVLNVLAYDVPHLLTKRIKNHIIQISLYYKHIYEDRGDADVNTTQSQRN